MEMIIIRTAETKHQTIGQGMLIDKSGQKNFDFCTLELPFLGNQSLISCIPLGSYKVEKRRSEKFGTHFHILDVQDRTLILIHVGNYHRNSTGCILVGSEHKYLNKDSELDVANSLETMKKLLELLPATFNLTIMKV